MGYVALPLSVKKYIKIPDRRLISGLLTINCGHHHDNDSYDDANEYFYTNWGDATNVPAKIKEARPWNNTQSANFNRAGYKHTFGDYDCLLFWVAGGMTLQTPVFTGGRQSQSALHGASYLTASSGSANWTDGTGSPSAAYDSNEEWYTGVTHSCQHFLKSHLIGRMNNGYGHTSADYDKINSIATHTFEQDDVDTSFNSGVAYLDDDITGEPADFENQSGARKGLWKRFISSNGTFSNDSDGDFIVDLSTASNNTYFPMIEAVEIYGKHNYTIPTHTNGSGGTVYSNGNTSVGNYAHQDNFWSMVIKIKYRSYANNYATDVIGTHEFFKSRTNIFFQPFGETASFKVDDSLHT